MPSHKRGGRRTRWAAWCLIVLLLIQSTPPLPVWAADGSGTVSVNPTSAVAGSTGNTFAFTYTASEAMNDGGVRVAVPAGWSAPQASAGTAGRVTVSSTGTIGRSENTLDSASGWDWSSTIAVVTLSADTSVKKQGTASLKAAVAASIGTSKLFYNYGSGQDWSGYTKVGFWMRSDIALALGGAKFKLSSSTNLPSNGTTTTYNISSLSAGAWTYVSIDLTGAAPSTRNAVRSYGFELPAVGVLTAFYFDNVMLGPSTAATFSGQTIEVPLMDLASSGTVTVTYGAGGGTSGATVGSTSGSNTVTVSSRLDSGGTFTNLSSLPSINLTAGTVSALQFSAEPSTVSAGLNMSPLSVTLKDSNGNTVTNDNSTQVTLRALSTTIMSNSH